VAAVAIWGRTESEVPMLQTGSPPIRRRPATPAPAASTQRPDAVQRELLGILREAVRDPRTEVTIKALDETGKVLRSYQSTLDTTVPATVQAPSNPSRVTRLRRAGQAVRAVVHPVVIFGIYALFSSTAAGGYLISSTHSLHSLHSLHSPHLLPLLPLPERAEN
jgi:hypothetical protein